MKKESIYKGISYFQIAGGFIGFMAMVIRGLSSELNSLQGIVLFIASLLFISTTFAGYFLLQNKKIGETLTIITQFLQLLSFQYLGITYLFHCGLDVYLSWQGSNLGAGIDTGSAFAFKFSQYAGEIEIKINLLAVVILYWIVKNTQPDEKKNSQ